MIYGYARVSTVSQSTDAQVKILKDNGCDEVLTEIYTRRTTKRPVLEDILEKIKLGDTLMVTKLDRLAGNTREALDLIQRVYGAGVQIHILNMGIINKTPQGRLIYTIFSAFAEFEVEIIKERMLEGKSFAKQNPNYKDGRPVKYTKVQKQHAIELLKHKTYKEVEQLTGISKSTLIRFRKKDSIV